MRKSLLALTVLATLALSSSSASANFHLTKISEVYPGTAVCPDCAFVELQAYQAGQNQVTEHTILVKDAMGNNIDTFGFGSNPPNAQTQRTILMGDSSVTGKDQEANFGTLILPAGGAICFDAIDCVAWGNITPAGLASLPSPASPPVAPGGIPDGSSLTRSIASGCATLLEESDDTNSSMLDFAVTATETPRGNSVTPTETACGGGGVETVIDRGPKKKTTKKKATFRFSSPNAGATFECQIDKKAFKACSSPKVYKRVKKGKHTFKVRAVVDGTADPTPASYKWKVKKPRKKK